MTIQYVLLPNGRQVFIDANGKPLAGGSVGMYEPGTFTPQTTWQDPGGLAANVNPVPLDAAGSALIYGIGQYRQIVKDANGVTLWDALTYGVLPPDPSNTGFGAQTNIASAATVDLGSILTHNALVTGTETISSFGNTADLAAPLYYVEFDSDATVTYDASSLITPGNQDLEMSHGDGILIEYEGNSNWKVIAWFPQSGYGVGTQEPLASAALCDIGSIKTHNILITGTTDISSFGGAASLSAPIYRVEFDDVLDLQHDNATFILPGNQDITTAAGDCAEFEFIGTTSWRCRTYSPASGFPPVLIPPQSRTFIETANGAFNITLPDNVVPSTRIKFTVVAPGGAGGSTSGTGNTGGGQGGGSGGVWQGVLFGFHGGDHITGTVGANGGVGVASGNGNAGNALTKFTNNAIDVVVCNPGKGGSLDAGAGLGAGGTVVTDFSGLTLEAEIYNQSVDGLPGQYASSDVNVSGHGADCQFGAGGASRIYGSGGGVFAGFFAEGFGAGGGGGGGTGAGGTGAPGFFLMEMVLSR